MSSVMIGIILVLVIVAIILFHYRKKIKRLKVPNVFLITGTVGGGKTSLAVYLAIKENRKAIFLWYLGLPLEHLKKWFWKKFKHKDYVIEGKPMLYTNMPLKYPYNKLTKEIIFREVRIPFKSTVLIDESSLMADSLMYKSDKFNDKLREFFKLFRHETHGGTCIISTQVLADNHLSIRRVLGHYLYIHDRLKVPFVTILSVREMIVSDGDNSLSNDFDGDVEDSLKKVWFFNSIYKKFDTHYLSVLTDNLQIQVDYGASKKLAKGDLKAEYVLDLREDYYELLKIEKENKK